MEKERKDNDEDTGEKDESDTTTVTTQVEKGGSADDAKSGGRESED